MIIKWEKILSEKSQLNLKKNTNYTRKNSSSKNPRGVLVIEKINFELNYEILRLKTTSHIRNKAFDKKLLHHYNCLSIAGMTLETLLLAHVALEGRFSLTNLTLHFCGATAEAAADRLEIFINHAIDKPNSSLPLPACLPPTTTAQTGESEIGCR